MTADPDRPHRIRNWAVPVRIGVTEAEIRGTLDWVPPPNPWLWWLLSLLGAGVVAALSLGLNLGRRSAGAVEAAGSAGSAGSLRRGATSVVPGSLCVVGGLAAIGYAVGREVDGGATGVVAVATGVFVSQLWPVLAGLGAIVVGLITTGLTTAVIRATGRGRGGDGRRPAGDFPLALAGVCLALFAGVSEAGVFGWGVAPVPFSPTLARVAVAAAIAIGAGTAVAAALRLRAAVPGSGPDTTAGAAGAAERQEAS